MALELISAAIDHVGIALSSFTDLVIGGTTGGTGGTTSGQVTQDTANNFATTIRNFVAPLVLLAIGLAALTYLFKRQMTQFFQFMGIAVLVGVFFYTPGVVPAIAKFVGGLLGGTPLAS